MNFLNLFGIFRSKELVPAQHNFPAVEEKSEFREYQIGDIGSWLEHVITGSPVNTHTAYEMKRQSSVLTTAIELIAKKAEPIQPVIERDGEFTTDDEVLEFLHRPNEVSLWRQFLGTTVRDYLLTGNFYYATFGNVNFPPISLYNFHPLKVGVAASSIDGFADRYDVTGWLGQGTYIRQDFGDRRLRFVCDGLKEIYHFRDYTSRPEGLIGDSPVESIVDEIRQHILGNTHNSSMLKNGGKLSLLFHLQEQMSDDQFRRAKERILDNYAGPHNAGKVGVFASSEAEVKELGVNNKDMDFVKLYQVLKQAVYTRYSIPLPVVMGENMTLNNYETAVQALYDDAVLPVVDIVFEALSDILLPKWGRDPSKERITYDPQAIPALRKRMLEELKMMSELGALTTNEKRNLMPDLEDIEGGDYILGPASNVPIAGSGIDPGAFVVEDRDEAQQDREAARQAMENGGSDKDDE